jgi:hypothetical protein
MVISFFIGLQRLNRLVRTAANVVQIRRTHIVEDFLNIYTDSAILKHHLYVYVFAVFTTLFYSKLRPTVEPDYSTLEQTSFFQNSFVQKGTYRD